MSEDDDRSIREKIDYRSVLLWHYSSLLRMTTSIGPEFQPKVWARQFSWAVRAFVGATAPYHDAGFAADMKRVDAWVEAERAKAKRDPDFDREKTDIESALQRMEAVSMLLARKGALMKESVSESWPADEAAVEGEVYGA